MSIKTAKRTPERVQPVVLGLDLATKTGFAFLDSVYPEDNVSGTFDFGFHPDESLGSKLFRLRLWLNNLYTSAYPYNCPTLLVYERAHLRGAGSYLLTSMAAIVELWAVEEEIPAVSVHTGTLKKFATGSGKATKSDMIEAAKKRWPKISLVDDNHADGLWLAAYGTEYHDELLGLK